MATGLLCSTKEVNKFARLCKLLLDGGTHVLKDVFDKIHPPGTLHKVLHIPAVRNTLKGLRSKRVLTTEQWKKLYPSTSKSVTSSGFDITLLLLLLRSICNLNPPGTGWNNPPVASDSSNEADLVRIKLYRNSLYDHATQARIRDSDFETHWNEIESVLVRLGGTGYEQLIQRLKLDSMDPDDEAYYSKLLEEWEQFERSWKKMINETGEIKIQEINQVVMDFEKKKTLVMICLHYALFGNLRLKKEQLIYLCNECLQMARYLGDIAIQPQVWLLLGSMNCEVSRFRKALNYFNKALMLARNIKKRDIKKAIEIEAYCGLGNCYLFLGQYDKAIPCHEKRLEIAEETRDKTAESLAHGDLGLCYLSLGQCNRAICHHKIDLNAAKKTGDKEGMVRAYGNLGNCYYSLGQYYDAIQLDEKALDIAEKTGDVRAEANMYGNLGLCFYFLGQFDEAIHYHTMQFNIANEIGDRLGLSHAYGNLGLCYSYLGQYDKAIYHLEKYLNIAKEIGDKEGEGVAYGNLGICYLKLGWFSKSLLNSERNLNISKEIGNKAGEANGHCNLGHYYLSRGQFDKAQYHNEMYLNIVKEIGDLKGIATAYRSLGTCYYRSRNMKKAEVNLRESLKYNEKLFENLREREKFKISIFETDFIGTYKLLTLVLFETKQNMEALLVSERGRARALGDFLISKYETLNDNTAKTNQLQHSDVYQLVSCKRFCVLVLIEGKPKYTFFTCVIAAEKELIFLQNNFAKISSDVKMSTELEQPESLVGMAIRFAYDEMKVREVGNCEDRSLNSFLAVDKDEAAETFLTEKRDAGKEKERTTSSLRSSFPRKEQNKESHKEHYYWNLGMLYQIIVNPVKDFLHQDEIVVIPEGPLYFVPFAALQDPDTGRFLSETKRIRLAPSLMTLKVLTDCRKERYNGRGALIVGNPKVGKVLFKGKARILDNLPAAEEESKVIGSILGVEPLVGCRATKEEVKRRLRSDVAVIHIAAHGRAETGEIALAPSESAMAAGIPNEQDYILTMADVQEAGVRAQLIVLSCCHSGRGEVKPEGVIGISRAFLASGARAVIASLWAINDEATLCFMKLFYTFLKEGHSASTSLQKTMNEMRKSHEWSAPRYWAPFFIIGDDVTIMV